MPSDSFVRISKCAIMFVLCAFVFDLSALQPQDHVSNPLLNERAKSLYEQLKCPVCQGQSIAESDADMAIRMREEVRRLLQNGLSDIEIRDTFSQNMGEDVLLQPSFGMRSFVLWFTPFIAGIIFMLFAWRRFMFNTRRSR